MPAQPPITGPLCWVLWSGWWTAFWLLFAVVDSIGFLAWVAFSLVALTLSVAWYQRRIEQRQAWRRERAVAWFLKEPLEAPVYTDWTDFEAALKVPARDRRNGRRAL